MNSAILGFNKAMTMLSTFLAFFFFIFNLPVNTIFVSSMNFIPAPSGGPESFAFDSDGYAYTGVNDGRILKYQGSDIGYVDFAYASPTRDKGLCDGKNETALGLVCGRALGLAFDEVSNELYIADAYHGLHVVGPRGGRATQLLSSAEGIPFKWLDGLDVDQKTGNVYITEMSNNYNLSQRHELLAAGKDGSGRLIEYNPRSKSARVLLTGLEGASGVGVSKNGTFVLVSEHSASRITKYWLKGPKANTAEVLLSNVTEPGNIRTDIYGWFFIACNIKLDEEGIVVRKGIIIDDSGTELGDTNWGPPYTKMLVTEFHETVDGDWYLGTLDESFGIVLP